MFCFKITKLRLPPLSPLSPPPLFLFSLSPSLFQKSQLSAIPRRRKRAIRPKSPRLRHRAGQISWAICAAVWDGSGGNFRSRTVSLLSTEKVTNYRTLAIPSVETRPLILGFSFWNRLFVFFEENFYHAVRLFSLAALSSRNKRPLVHLWWRHIPGRIGVLNKLRKLCKFS